MTSCREQCRSIMSGSFNPDSLDVSLCVNIGFPLHLDPHWERLGLLWTQVLPQVWCWKINLQWPLHIGRSVCDLIVSTSSPDATTWLETLKRGLPSSISFWSVCGRWWSSIPVPLNTMSGSSSPFIATSTPVSTETLLATVSGRGQNWGEIKKLSWPTACFPFYGDSQWHVISPGLFKWTR